jgi:hypothetical protein
MSKLIFDGAMHTISLVSSDGKVVGTWTAYNNVDSHATLTHLRNGSYNVQDRSLPHRHTPNANGPYGLYGIIRFYVAGHPGIGVHSGRVHAHHLPGPQHPTLGCIRTTDNAMSSIINMMATSPLTTVEVRNNTVGAARFGAHSNQYKVLN